MRIVFFLLELLISTQSRNDAPEAHGHFLRHVIAQELAIPVWQMLKPARLHFQIIILVQVGNYHLSTRARFWCIFVGSFDGPNLAYQGCAERYSTERVKHDSQEIKTKSRYIIISLQLAMWSDWDIIMWKAGRRETLVGFIEPKRIAKGREQPNKSHTRNARIFSMPIMEQEILGFMVFEICSQDAALYRYIRYIYT